jgi:hypothetical protein
MSNRASRGRNARTDEGLEGWNGRTEVDGSRPQQGQDCDDGGGKRAMQAAGEGGSWERNGVNTTACWAEQEQDQDVADVDVGTYFGDTSETACDGLVRQVFPLYRRFLTRRSNINTKTGHPSLQYISALLSSLAAWVIWMPFSHHAALSAHQPVISTNPLLSSTYGP